MFKVIDNFGTVYDAYDTFVDGGGDIQFILCDSLGNFYKTDEVSDTYRLYREE